MGSRGPLRQPDSRRGAAEMPGFRTDAPELPDPPVWLNAKSRVLFESLVEDLAAARVPIKRVDAHAIGQAAQCIEQAQHWARKQKRAKTTAAIADCAKLAARYQRDVMQWLAVICATPAARARIGLRATEEKKQGTVLSILAAKKLRGS